MIKISAVSRYIVQNSFGINPAGPSRTSQPLIQLSPQTQIQQSSDDQTQPSLESRKRKRGCLQLIRTKRVKNDDTNNGEREVIELE